MQDMTYLQLASRIDANIPTCENKRLQEVLDLLATPLAQAYNGKSGHCEEHRSVPEANKPQRVSLGERLKNKTTLKDCIMLNMNVQDFLPFCDRMVSADKTHFEHIYERYFQEYQNHTFISLIAESVQMPEEQRRNIHYNLLIKPFACLNRQLGNR